MKKKCKVALLVIVPFILSCFFTAYANDSTPESVIKKFYQADFEGAKLSSEGYKRIKPLITWEHEPGWDLVFITKEAKINKIEQMNYPAASYGVSKTQNNSSCISCR